MEVTHGWSTEYARKKFSVTLDDTDLIRILDDAEMEIQPILLTSREAFKLLDTEAHLLAEAEKLHTLLPGSPDRASVLKTLDQLEDLKKRHLDKITARFRDQ